MPISFSPPADRDQRARGAGVTAVLGPTNTGKTHLAIERMLSHSSGLIGLPLRLLAREVYNRAVERVGADSVALITGEEKIKPSNPRFWVATVEAMPRDLDVAFHDRKVDDVRLTLAGGNVTEYAVEPPLPPVPDRIPVTEADRHGVFDPMTSMLNRVSGNGDPVSPEACNRRVPVFDGRVRYDLRSEFRRIENVKAEHGYEGPAVVCAVYFTPISGYVPDRPAIRYLVQLHDAEVWLAPISGTRVLVPFRFSMPTPLGTGLLQATSFVSVAPPSRAAAKTQ